MNRARTKIMERRYRADIDKQRSVLTACWIECGGRWRMLQGWADRSKTRSGRLYNRRIRLVRRFGLSPFRREAAR